MDINLNNKIAVVTGGSQGIGRAICERLVAAGSHVVVADLKKSDDFQQWQNASGGQVSYLQTDVSSGSSVQALAEHIEAQHGRVDVLVNNAGIMFEKSLEEQSEADWDLMMSINVKGPMLMSKFLLPLLRNGAAKNGSAAVVNIGSIEGFAVNPKHTAYSASKGAVHGFTAALAVDLGVDKIRVNAIAPGWIDTDLNRAYVESAGDVELAKQELAKLHPMGSIGEPSDVGDVVVWLASDESRFVNGQVITVDGARTRKLSLPSIFQT